MSVIDTLITDRTQNDVDQVHYLNSKWMTLPDGSLQWSGTTDELALWTAGLKGSYNAQDLNRVGTAMVYLAEELNALGYMVTVFPKTNWNEEDVPSSVDMEAYLQQVATLRAVIPVFSTTPDVPLEMNYLTYQEANNIEKILVDIETLIFNMKAAFRHCNAAVCGGSGLLIL